MSGILTRRALIGGLVTGAGTLLGGCDRLGADPRFRKLAQQILAREAPAHLRCRLLWLDAGQMQAFETAWHGWLTARQAHCAAMLAPPGAHDEGAAVKNMDECSAQLRALLQELA